MADARTFIKVHDGIYEHPKVEELSDKAFRHLITLWCFCSRNYTDGKVPERTWKRITTSATSRELISNRLAEAAEGGYEMHDYLEHQRSRAEIEYLTEKRRVVGKKGGLARAQGQANAQASATANSKQTSSRAEQSRADSLPSPSHDPASTAPTTLPPVGGEREKPTQSRVLAATLLGIDQADPRLDHLPRILRDNNVRAPGAWLRTAASNGDLEALLNAAPADIDPWAHLPRGIKPPDEGAPMPEALRREIEAHRPKAAGDD